MGGRGGGACNWTKNVFHDMLNQQCLFKLQNAIKKISFQYKLEGAYIGGRWGMGLKTRCIFCLQEDGLIFEGGGGAYTCNWRRGNNRKYTVTCGRLLNY